MSQENTKEIQKFLIPPDYHVLMASIVYLKTRFTWDEELIKNENMIDGIQEMTNSFFENLELYRSSATDRTDFVSYSIFPAPEPQTSIQNVAWTKRGGEEVDQERAKALMNFFKFCDELTPNEKKEYERVRHRFLRLELLNFLTSDRLNKSIEKIADSTSMIDTKIWYQIAQTSMLFCKNIERGYLAEDKDQFVI